nr:hypothetical protein [Paracoccus saliphilus]
MQFQRTIGIDYSGAETADSSLKSLRVYETEGGGPALEVGPPPGPKRYWTRRGLAGWLIERLTEPVPTIVGIDHAFSFPEAYYRRHTLPRDWDVFLDDFHHHWPTDQPSLYVDFLRHQRDTHAALAARRTGERRWRRRVEELARAKSVFHFEVTGQVAKSTHAGLPFLRHIRRALPKLHVWPFDGWSIPINSSALVEAYPRLYSTAYAIDDRTPDQHDAFATASWLRDADMDGRLTDALAPKLGEPTARLVRHEGWIVGVTSDQPPPSKSETCRAGRPRHSRSVKGTTTPGYRNPNGQVVIASTGLAGTDHYQKVYHICCGHCGLNYGANGSDIHARRCPACGGGRPGLVI